jgi:octanoyl-[GcvH]:protein N-octanoyltransferase
LPAAGSRRDPAHAPPADATEVVLETLRLIRHSFPDHPELSTAISRTILRRVAAGELPPTIRIHRPGNEVAFGRQDIASPGYAAAAEAARAAGFAAVERLAGGRAAVFHQGTIAIARAYRDPQPPKRTYSRFEEMADLITNALRGLGVDARVGEIPGEYCPGAYSVNARGRAKLAGIGQRMIRGGAHMGGVVVASGGGEVARVLEPVYRALELDFDPPTSGSVSDELQREVDAGEIEEAVIAELAKHYELVDTELDQQTVETAGRSLEVKAGG